MSEFKGFKKSDGTLIPCRDDSKQATLTTQQLAAINSGITSEKVAKIATIDERTANVSQLALDVEQIKAVSITYAELKALRDACQLVPGRQYRITDYHCTTTQADTMSADHQFDIIVVADTNSVLNENARACLHVGDTYFSSNGCKLESWQLKYTLLPTDNDIFFFVDDGWKYVRNPDLDDEDNGFAWCYYDEDAIDTSDIMYTSSENPSIGDVAIQDGEEYEIYAVSPYLSKTYRGKINFMKDDNNNSCFYDFKNILFKRWKITICNKSSSLVGFYSSKNTTGITINEEDYVWCYTFNKWDVSNSCYVEGDSSIVGSVYGNKLGYESMNIVLFGNTCNSNIFGNSCYGNTLGNGSIKNTFGNTCNSNIFGNACNSNTFGNDFRSNTFGNSCSYNIFGNACNSNTFGNSCSYNIFGNSSSYNTFGNSSSYNTLGNACKSNTFVNTSQSNTFGNWVTDKSLNNTSKQQFWS